MVDAMKILLAKQHLVYKYKKFQKKKLFITKLTIDYIFLLVRQ